MKFTNNQLKEQGKTEKKRAVDLGKNNKYYKTKLNRSDTAISLAFSGDPGLKNLLARITTHNNWLERNKQSV